MLRSGKTGRCGTAGIGRRVVGANVGMVGANDGPVVANVGPVGADVGPVVANIEFVGAGKVGRFAGFGKDGGSLKC